jgi:hypothetical protein
MDGLYVAVNALWGVRRTKYEPYVGGLQVGVKVM